MSDTTRAPPPRQTLSYLRRLFEAHGLEARSKLGQNFLIDLNLLDLIVRTAELDRSDAVLAAHGCTRRKLVANLPYVIATPIISNLLIAGVPIERMVVMVQWEIA